MSERWRVGRSVGRTIYIGDELIGLMDTPELAQQVVEAVNELDRRDNEIDDCRAAIDRERAAHRETAEALAALRRENERLAAGLIGGTRAADA
jgi:hypothetical protein